MSYWHHIAGSLAIAGILLIVGGMFAMAAGVFEKDAPGKLSATSAAFVLLGIFMAAWSPIAAWIAVVMQ